MPRKAPPSPVGHRAELNARALINENNTRPIIMTRDRQSTARLSQVRGNVLVESRVDTPRNMYDYDDAASVSIYSMDARTRRQSTQVNLPASRRIGKGQLDKAMVPHRRNQPDVVPNNDQNLPRRYRNGIDDQDSVISAVTVSTPLPRYHNQTNKMDGGMSTVEVIPYPKGPYQRDYPYHRDVYVRRRRQRSSVYEMVPVSPWYFVLKLVELVVCIIMIIVTRLGYADLEHDIVFTMFAFLGIIVAGLSLLLLWVKGQPAPNHCLHPVMLFAYIITAAVMLCGAVLVLTQDDLNGYAAGTATLFFLALILFAMDTVLMAMALMYCTCLPFPESLRPRQRIQSRTHIRARSRARTYPIVVEGRNRSHRDSYPVAAVADNPDSYYVRKYHRRSPEARRHNGYSDGGSDDYADNRDRIHSDNYPVAAVDDNPDYYYVRYYHHRSPEARRHNGYSDGGSDYYADNRDRLHSDSYPVSAIDDPDHRYDKHNTRGSPQERRQSGYGGGAGGNDHHSNHGHRHYPVGELLHNPSYVERYGEYLRDRYPPVGHPR